MTRKSKVAIFTLDSDYKEPLVNFLCQERIDVELYSSAAQLLEHNQFIDYDLFIVDYVLEDYNGYFVTKLIRRTCEAPIIFISNNGDEASVIRAFGHGVDEFLHKPISLRELTIRVIFLIKKYNTQFTNKVIKINGIVYDRVQNKIFINNVEVNLTPTELRIIKILIDKAGEIVSSKELLNSVWGWNESMGTPIVSTNINRIRKKLGRDKISTIKGQGYRFEV